MCLVRLINHVKNYWTVFYSNMVTNNKNCFVMGLFYSKMYVKICLLLIWWDRKRFSTILFTFIFHRFQGGHLFVYIWGMYRTCNEKIYKMIIAGWKIKHCEGLLQYCYDLIALLQWFYENVWIKGEGWNSFGHNNSRFDVF